MSLNTRAVFEDLNDKNYHDEIAEWFRYSDRSARDRRDGLDARCMNVLPFNLWIAAKFPFLMRLPISRQILSAVYKRQYWVITTLGIISGGFWEPSNAFNAGRFLIRFWLECSRNDLYIHPFGNLATNRHARLKWRLS